MRRLALPLLLLALALACAGVALFPAHRPAGIALPIPISHTTELDINVWDNWLVTVWWQDAAAGTNRQIAHVTLPIWPAIAVAAAGGALWAVVLWRRRR